jgi:HSP20 family protein
MALTLKPRWSVMFPKSLDAMQSEVDSMFDTLLNGTSTRNTWPAPASLWEEEGSWRLEVELPGVKQENVDITVEKNTLRIVAERPSPEDRKYFHQERGYGRIERQITLPETVNPESIEAELKDGVLSLVLAKRPESQPRKIAVKASK